MAHLHRTRADLLLALGDPPVPRIARVAEERRQRALIRADRRMRPPARGDPLLDLRRRPLPRPRPGELGEPAHQPDPPVDQRAGQPPGGLLPPPALQHRLEQRRLRPQRHRAVHQHQGSRPRGLPRPGHRPPRRMRQMQSCEHPAQPNQMPHPGTRRNQDEEPPGQRRVAITGPRPGAATPRRNRRQRAVHRTAIMHRAQPRAPGCIARSASATMMHAAQRNQSHHRCIRSRRSTKSQVTAAARRPATSAAAVPHAGPQAARVHATCRMMHQMQFFPFAATWLRSAAAYAG